MKIITQLVIISTMVLISTNSYGWEIFPQKKICKSKVCTALILEEGDCFDEVGLNQADLKPVFQKINCFHKFGYTSGEIKDGKIDVEINDSIGEHIFHRPRVRIPADKVSKGVECLEHAKDRVAIRGQSRHKKGFDLCKGDIITLDNDLSKTGYVVEIFENGMIVFELFEYSKPLGKRTLLTNEKIKVRSDIAYVLGKNAYPMFMKPWIDDPRNVDLSKRQSGKDVQAGTDSSKGDSLNGVSTDRK